MDKFKYYFLWEVFHDSPIYFATVLHLPVLFSSLSNNSKIILFTTLSVFPHITTENPVSIIAPGTLMSEHMNYLSLPIYPTWRIKSLTLDLYSPHHHHSSPSIYSLAHHSCLLTHNSTSMALAKVISDLQIASSLSLLLPGTLSWFFLSPFPPF